EVHLVGVCTDICILHTAIEAYNKGLDIVVHKDAVASFNQPGHEWALGHFENTLGAKVIYNINLQYIQKRFDKKTDFAMINEKSFKRKNDDEKDNLFSSLNLREPTVGVSWYSIWIKSPLEQLGWTIVGSDASVRYTRLSKNCVRYCTIKKGGTAMNNLFAPS